MIKEQEFFIYLLECYAKYKDLPTSKVLNELDDLELTDFICNDMYWRYSTEAIENAFEDIDLLIAEKKGKMELNELNSTCGISDDELTERFKASIRIDNEIRRIKGLPIPKYDAENRKGIYGNLFSGVNPKFCVNEK